jgi:hypothetical protein
MKLYDPRLTGGRRSGPDRKLSFLKEVELVRDWRAGAKVGRLAQTFGVSKPTLYSILDRHSAGRRRRGGPVPTTEPTPRHHPDGAGDAPRPL